MALRDCLDGVKAAAGGVLSDEEVLDLLERMSTEAATILERRPWANIQEELFGRAEQMAKREREAALIERRNAAINARIKPTLTSFAAHPLFEKDPYKARVAVDVGSLGLKVPGGRLSVAAKSVSLARRWLGGFVAALEKEHLLPVLRSKTMDLQVAKELWELGKEKGKPGITGSKEAAAAAKVIQRLQDMMLSRLNRAGAWIHRMPGYIVRQSHDALKLRKAKFEKWMAAVDGKIDEPRTFGRELNGVERGKIYRDVYDQLAAGYRPPVADALPPGGFQGGANLAKKVSQSRELHFTDAEGWFNYNREFGHASLMETLVRTLAQDARAVALLETYGTNPEVMREWFGQHIDERSMKAGKRVSDERRGMPADAMWATISGEGSRPASLALARTFIVARSVQSLGKLGSAVVSALADTPTIAHEMHRHGVPLMAGYASGFTNLVARFTNSADKRMAHNMLGAYSEGTVGDLVSRWDSGDGVPGAISWMERKFFKLTGLSGWTDAHRAGVVRMMSTHMADRLGTAFDKLPEDYRSDLGAYGINAADWARLKGAITKIDGRGYVLPQRLVADASLADAAARRADRHAIDELSTKLETFFSDRMDTAVLQPGARERTILFQGTRPGTPEGEMLRMTGQFKAFPTAVLTRIWGERLSQSDYAGLAAVLVGMTVFGHLSNMARDTLKGIAQPDYTDPANWPSIFGRAFLAGGSAGMFGDFLLGEYSKTRSFVAAMAGPILGQADVAMDLFTRSKTHFAALFKHQAPKEGNDLYAAAFKAFWDNVPGNNIWYARAAMNYLFVYQMQEMLNPGYLRRMEQKLDQTTGQHFILPPSQASH